MINQTLTAMVVQIVLLNKSTLSLNEDQQPNDKRNLLILFKFSYFYFLSHSFGIETINTFTRSRSSLENHTRLPKMGNFYNRFQTKPNQKPHPLVRHLPYIAYVRDYPPDPHVQVTEKKKFAEAEGDNRIFNAGFAISNNLNHSGYEYLSMKYFAKLVFN